MIRWIKSLLAPRLPEPPDVKYEKAISLADEVTVKMRERANSIHPFRSALSDMLLGHAPADPVLMADAYETLQESRIYRGPPNGKG